MEFDYGDRAKTFGATGTEKVGRFAKFPTEEAGMKALKDLLNSDLYKDLTPEKAIEKYAPSGDKNDPKKYSEFLKKQGIDPSKKVGEQADKMAEGIKKYEGWKEGTAGKKPENTNLQNSTQNKAKIEPQPQKTE